MRMLPVPASTDTGWQIIWFALSQLAWLAADFLMTGAYEIIFKSLSLISVVFLILVNWEGGIRQIKKWFKWFKRKK